MAKKVRMMDMSHKDRNDYRYYRRILHDLHLYGPHYLKQLSQERVNYIREKYSTDESSEKK